MKILKKNFFTILIWGTVAGFTALYVSLIFNHNIWTDEAFTLQLLRENVKGIIDGTARDVHPPLYYLYAKIFTVIFGDALLVQKVAALLDFHDFEGRYTEIIVIYFVLGILAVLILGELRKMFRTVLQDDCFVKENVVSLQRMGTYSFMIAVICLLRTVLYLTIAMLVLVLVFIIAGLFSKVLAFVFDRAVEYKLENDLTI